MIPACTSRCPPVLSRKSFSSVSSSGPSPPKTRSGRIYKKRSLSPQPPSPTSTPRSAPPLHKRRPTPNNINLKLNLLQSDIRPSSDSPCYMKSRFQVETTSASDRSDQEESEALIKRRMELPQSLPELASPKLTAPPKLNAKLKRPVSRLSLQRYVKKQIQKLLLLQLHTADKIFQTATRVTNDLLLLIGGHHLKVIKWAQKLRCVELPDYLRQPQLQNYPQTSRPHPPHRASGS